MTAQSQSLVTLVVNGKPIGVFQTRSGGETTAEISKYRPGGGAAQKARRGQREHGDVTVSREWERERDLIIERDLRLLCGRAKASVTDQPLDEDGVVFGKPVTYTGVLMSVNGGDSDSDSDDGKTLEVGLTVLEVS
jgi:hypothetical protein